MRSFFIAGISLGCFKGICASPASSSGQLTKSGLTGFQNVFQVQTPLRASYEGAACQQVIVQHEFAASYGTPFVGMNPPFPLPHLPVPS